MVFNTLGGIIRTQLFLNLNKTANKNFAPHHKILLPVPPPICNLATEFNGLVSWAGRKTGPSFFIVFYPFDPTTIRCKHCCIPTLHLQFTKRKTWRHE